MSTNNFTLFIAFSAIIGAILLTAVLVFSPSARGAAGSGSAGIATSSTIQVGPQEVKTIFVRTSGNACAARAIGSVGSTVTLSFSPTITPSATVGFLQSSSTTAMYESEYFGCGAVRAYAAASSTITLTEFSQ